MKFFSRFGGRKSKGGSQQSANAYIPYDATHLAHEVEIMKRHNEIKAARRVSPVLYCHCPSNRKNIAFYRRYSHPVWRKIRRFGKRYLSGETSNAAFSSPFTLLADRTKRERTQGSQTGESSATIFNLTLIVGL